MARHGTAQTGPESSRGVSDPVSGTVNQAMSAAVRRVKLGVTFVNYRRPDLLIEAVNSLETSHHLRLFIVDRGRRETEIPSLAAAWNRGIESALAWGADFVIVAGDDILFHPLTVDSLVDRAMTMGYEFLSPYDVKKRLGKGPEDLASVPVSEVAQDEQAADYACFMLTPSLFREVGPFDENFVPAYFEDADYNLRLGMAGRPGMLTNRALFFHHGGASGGIPLEISIRNRSYFINKWKDLVPWVEAFATTGGHFAGHVTTKDPGDR